MSYSVKSLASFEKQAKRIIKKYPSLKQEIFDLIQSLKDNPEQGTSLGKNSFKIRLSIASKQKGKSGGARVITNIVIQEKIVYLVSIYDKSEVSSVTDKELDELLKQIK